MNIRILTLFFCLTFSTLSAQFFEGGVETLVGQSYTTFEGNLSSIVGFESLEITEEQIDQAFTDFGITAPRWVRDLFPGIRLDVNQEIAKQLSRQNSAVRVWGRFHWFGASLMIGEPRLAEKAASKKWSNQLKSLRLAMNGETEALAEHLALIAVAETQQVKPFFAKRYDLDFYVHLKKMVFGDDPLLEWGEQGYLDASLVTGLRLTADPSPVVELGSILFISEKLDSLLEGGLLRPVENTTDQIALAVQSTVFGKFKDPRVVTSMGWFVRGELPAHLTRSFTVTAGAEVGLSKHLALTGIKPMFSAFGFVGLRWQIGG
ncbi:MAG: hypothetical protein HC892_13995 [Saprospiraceae bacterium]|nr:hypothetical protein [Saprospiraceae bacterium]